MFPALIADLRARPRVFFALFLILLAAFMLRLAAFDHPLAQGAGEGLRDLFVAEHALQYGEWPIDGYQNGLSSFKNSPLYYYVVIAFAALDPSFLATGIMFILFTCATIAGVFALARGLFGDRAGLVSAGLLAIAPSYVEHVGTFVWPPYVVSTFVVGGFLALYGAYRARRPLVMTLSALLAVMAVAIHQSALPMLFMHALLLIYVIRVRGYSFRDGALTLIVSLTAFVALFLPPILSFTGSEMHWGIRAYSSAPMGREEAFHIAVKDIPYAFGAPRSVAGSVGTLLAISVAVLLGWFFLSRRVPKRHKVFLALLIGAAALQVCAAILIDPEGVPRHFEPALWMVAVALGALICAPIGRASAIPVICAIAAGALLAHGALTDQRMARVYDNIPAFERPNERVLESAADAMADTVERLRRERGYADYAFFDVYALADTHFLVSSYVFWEPLERKLGTELNQGPDKVMRDRVVQPGEDYLFIACLQHGNTYTPEQCLADASRSDPPRYQIEGTVFESDRLTVYLAHLAK